MHIDKVNEIIGLASGSKLNMLTKEQLLQLVLSKEFSPCVPTHLYKMKPAGTRSSASSVVASSSGAVGVQGGSSGAGVDSSLEKSRVASSNASTVDTGRMQVSHDGTRASNVGIDSIKNQRGQLLSSIHDEHPATAMHRLKLITAWFDSMTGEILSVNEMYNKKKVSRKVVVEETLCEVLKNRCGGHWPLMNYSHVRKSVGE